MMRRGGVAVAAFVLCWAAGGVAQPAGVAVEVTVTNVRSGRGHVRVAVCPRAAFLQPSCAWHAAAPAHVGSVVVAVPGVPPGVYAVQAFLDENDDGKINRSLLGIPEEGMGFSRDAPMRFGPPSFDDAAVQVGATGGAVSLRLRYFD